MNHQYFLVLSIFIALCSCNEENLTPISDLNIETAKCENCETFDHNGVQRTYYIKYPTNVDSKTILLFHLHSYHGDATFFNERILDNIPDKHNMIVVTPQGLPDSQGVLHWNAGFDISSVDDVGFLSAIAEKISQESNINPQKVYTFGFSNGGWMSYQLIYKRPDLFKAAGSIIGRMGHDVWSNRAEIMPASILQISGTEDKWQLDHTDNIDEGWGGAPEMAQQIAFWNSLNQCTFMQEESVTNNTTLFKCENVKTTKKVWYYEIEDMNHNIPLGEMGRIDSYQVTYDFFKSL